MLNNINSKNHIFGGEGGIWALGDVLGPPSPILSISDDEFQPQQLHHHHCPYLCEEDAVKELVGLLLVLGDVSVGIHTKHLRVRDDG